MKNAPGIINLEGDKNGLIRTRAYDSGDLVPERVLGGKRWEKKNSQRKSFCFKNISNYSKRVSAFVGSQRLEDHDHGGNRYLHHCT